MFYTDGKLQYPVRVETPNPIFARALQQAIGGVEGEIRVMMQCMFQGWGSRGPKKYRDMLINTGTEEIGHIEMLATAVALNLEGAPISMQEDAANDGVAGAVLGGMNLRHILSTGLAATPENCNGVPFNASHVYASGNLAADMYANVTAEATGRALATRLYGMTNDPGMKDMLSFLIARGTIHQQQWLAVIEELGGETAVFPIRTASLRSRRPTLLLRLFRPPHRQADPDGPLDRRRFAGWQGQVRADGLRAAGRRAGAGTAAPG